MLGKKNLVTIAESANYIALSAERLKQHQFLLLKEYVIIRDDGEIPSIFSSFLSTFVSITFFCCVEYDQNKLWIKQLWDAYYKHIMYSGQQVFRQHLLQCVNYFCPCHNDPIREVRYISPHFYGMVELTAKVEVDGKQVQTCIGSLRTSYM